ncbi:MAG: hypothetical protein ACK5LK_11730 [Chthoniobacterales bacterium]
MSVVELQEIVFNLAKSQTETDRQLKETDRQLKETDRRLKETDRQLKETMKAVEKMSGSIGREWGNLVESLTKTSCVEQLQAAGIKVTQTARDTESEREGYEQEWDVMLVNGGEVVAVEVKSRFRQGDLKSAEKKLAVFREAFPQYRKFTVYAGVAALKYNSGLDRLAAKRGFFVFEPSGEIMALTNKKGFKPKKW